MNNSWKLGVLFVCILLKNRASETNAKGMIQEILQMAEIETTEIKSLLDDIETKEDIEFLVQLSNS